ncbi:thioredoxin-like domain-containing protein [Barnesiella sp. An55]|uniref:thioredoxin-like domain-containing protein n=1 Tax=Barnesiella sp. An55 TaxID=1965646 RepID=UPI001302582E|nr:thioredoxin-like domain-containing protein [Barnesiella sp. An55]HIZ27038.1 redoxin domain-containing protein [Candidatus Barnesiella merdipullorum]
MKLVRLIGYITLATCLVNCSDQYRIDGQTHLFPDGTTLFLQRLNDQRFEIIDSATVKNGYFTFNGYQHEPAIAILVPRDERASQVPPLLLALEPGTIEVVFDSTTHLSGTPLNNRLQAYEEQRQTFDKHIQAITRLYLSDYLTGRLTNSTFTALKQAFEKEQEGLGQLTREYIAANTDNVTSVYLFLQNSFLFSPDEQRRLIDNAAKEFKKNPAIQKFSRMLSRMKNVAPNMPYTDLTLQTPEGREVTLSQYIGHSQYVLLDFWASWCPPCQRQTPFLKQLYNRYGKNQLSIIGISLDTDTQAWLDYVHENQMEWPQLGDPKGWDSDAILSYVIQGIPHFVLLGPDGTIVANNPSEEELNSLLSSRLKSK